MNTYFRRTTPALTIVIEAFPEDTLAPRPVFSGRLAFRGDAGMHALVRSGAMGRNNRSSKLAASRTEIPPHERGGPAKENPHNQVTVEEFERERMGIAAKE